MTDDQHSGDTSADERRGLSLALWAIIGLPLLFFIVSMVAWGIGQVLT